MTRNLAILFGPLGAALIVSGCTSTPPEPVVDESTAAYRAKASLCTSLTAATDSGNVSLRAAFVSTPAGRDYGGGVIRELTQMGKYRFVGAEMVGDTCYANADARGEQWGQTFNLVWRCPVKAVSDNPAEPGKTVLEVVEDRECDYDTPPGAPAKRNVEVELLHL